MRWNPRSRPCGSNGISALSGLPAPGADQVVVVDQQVDPRPDAVATALGRSDPAGQLGDQRGAHRAGLGRTEGDPMPAGRRVGGQTASVVDDEHPVGRDATAGCDGQLGEQAAQHRRLPGPGIAVDQQVRVVAEEVVTHRTVVVLGDAQQQPGRGPPPATRAAARSSSRCTIDGRIRIGGAAGPGQRLRIVAIACPIGRRRRPAFSTAPRRAADAVPPAADRAARPAHSADRPPTPARESLAGNALASCRSIDESKESASRSSIRPPNPAANRVRRRSAAFTVSTVCRPTAGPRRRISSSMPSSPITAARPAIDDQHDPRWRRSRADAGHRVPRVRPAIR